jgi:hypothetical protein
MKKKILISVLLLIFSILTFIKAFTNNVSKRWPPTTNIPGATCGGEGDDIIVYGPAANVENMESCMAKCKSMSNCFYAVTELGGFYCNLYEKCVLRSYPNTCDDYFMWTG